MSCPGELALLMRADGALPMDQAAELDLHVAHCVACRSALAALGREAERVTAALADQTLPDPVPAFRGAAGGRSLLLAGCGLVVVAGLVSAALRLVLALVPAPVGWFNPLDEVGLAGLAVTALVYLVENGGSLMVLLSETMAVAVLVGLLAWLVAGLGRRRSGPLMLVALLGMATLLPQPAQAIEIRGEREGQVLVAADETLADSLFAYGESVEIDGTVEGDVIAFARRVIVRGKVGGLLLTGAQTVTVEGEVTGTVLGMAETLDLADAVIGGNLFGMGNTVTSGERASVGQNAVVMGQRTNLAGSVGRDALGFGQEVEIAATVGGDLTGYANRASLRAPARVAGNVDLHVSQEDRLIVSPEARIDGELVTEFGGLAPERSRYSSTGFYVWQVLRFAAAFLAGLLLLLLVPGLRRVAVDTPMQAAVAGGIGLVALVATPLIAVLVAITVIGIPLALVGFAVWLTAVYLAHIVVAHFVGARLLGALGSERHFAVALVVGLFVVLVITGLPYLGPLLGFVLRIVGLGMLLLFCWHAVRGRPDASMA